MSVSKLHHLSLIKITGEDAAHFLQGQLTNDIEALDGNWQYSGYCNPKGRLLAILTLWKNKQAFYALMDKSVQQACIQRLRMYVLRSKVSIEEITNLNCYGRFGQESQSTTLGQLSIDSDTDVTELSFGSRSLLICPQQALEEKPAKAHIDQQWLRQDIAEGLARVTAQSAELFIPQMLNLDLLNGISFSKGCYTGQEIVARMHYLGKLKQRQYLCQFAQHDHQTNIGDKVLLASDPSKSAGTIASSINGYAKALLILRSEYANENIGEFKCENGARLTLSHVQPISLPDDKSPNNRS